MSDAKSPRKPSARKLEPIDWHEFANDAVLQGNMSTLFQRPAAEDPSAYASSEALAEIEKRRPTVGTDPSVGTASSVGSVPLGVASEPAVGPAPSAGTVEIPADISRPPEDLKPTISSEPPPAFLPTAGLSRRQKITPIREVQDALTLAGQILYRAMYGLGDESSATHCAKGYRQLAAETRLDKDTVRDLIAEFKEKGIVREVGTYNPDTRSSKTYEVLSGEAVVRTWRDTGLRYVLTGRQRPEFCNERGEKVSAPSGSAKPTVGELQSVGIEMAAGSRATVAELTDALQQIAGKPASRETADRLLRDCRALAPDCAVEEVIEIAWSKAFLCRSGKIEDPLGFLLAHVPDEFQAESLARWREAKRREAESVAVIAVREETSRREYEDELAAMEERQQVRARIAERYRAGQGIDLRQLLGDPEADEVLKEWARRLLKLGHRYHPGYQ